MPNHEQIIHEFYTAFAAGDSSGMVKHYHDDVAFEDPAFGKLKGEDAKNMWRMLISRGGENLKIIHKDVKADDDRVTAHWTARYPYGSKKRPVVNEVSATFEFRDGKIISHSDDFDLWKWSRQALGTSGLLLGWTGFMRKKIQSKTNGLLAKFTATSS